MTKLTKEDKNLIGEAKKLWNKKHSKKHSVSSILISKSGKKFEGMSMEFDGGTCAERVAIFKMLPDETKIKTLVAMHKNKILPPCGTCRELMYEIDAKNLNDMWIIISNNKKVKNWIENYAGEDMKFEIQEKVNVELSDPEKQAMISLKESLSIKDYTEDELFNEFYNICRETGITNKDFFAIAYEILIGKSKGPRLASLILAVGKDKIIKLLEKIK